MKWDLAKLMQEKLAEINKIKKKALLKDDKSFNVDLNKLLNPDKEEEEKGHDSHTVYLLKISMFNIMNPKIPKHYDRHLAFRSVEEMQEYANSKTEKERGKIELILIRNFEDNNYILDLKKFVNCNEGDSIIMIEFGGEPVLHHSVSNYNEDKVIFTRHIHGPTEIVKVHNPIVC